MPLVPSYSPIILDPSQRIFPEFSLKRLLSTVFDPIENCRVCLLTDFDDPGIAMKDFSFLGNPGSFPVQCKAHEKFFLGLKENVMPELGMTGGEMFAFLSLIHI